MDSTTDRHRRRLLIAAIAGGLVLILLVGLGVYGLLRGPAQPAGPADRTPGTPAAPAPSSARPPEAPQPIPLSTDAEGFARTVAEALFAWDTTTGYGPADYAQPLVDVGDPSGDETPGLASDIRSYLPTPEAWAQLRTYQTRQWLSIEAAFVPDAWEVAVAQAAPGQLPPGAIAYTIEGTRHRDGTWGTEPVEASRPVSFTVFLACSPPAPQFRIGPCHLLRLSQLDNPLR